MNYLVLISLPLAITLGIISAALVWRFTRFLWRLIA